MKNRGFLVALILGFSSQLLAAEQWNAWRGPRGDGTSKETGIPTSFSTTKNVRWQVEIPGDGYSSPIVWGDQIFLTSCGLDEKREEKSRQLICVSRVSGKIQWSKTVLRAPLERKHRLNSYASATPATDGKHVWVAFMEYPTVVVVCYDMNGKEVWRKQPGKLLSKHGFCSSPILYKNLVILNCDQDAQGYLVAYDKTSGKEEWRTLRPNKTRSYCTPIIVKAAGKDQLVFSGSRCVASYDPATGERHWIIDGPTEQYVASLVYTQDLLFLTAGFPTYHLMGIRPDGKGNVTKSHVAWHHSKLPAKEASYVPSPIGHGNYFYVVSDRGYASCFDAKSGERKWIQKLGRRHSASPVLVEGNLYFPSDEGIVYVVKAGPKFELIAKNKMGNTCYASPAVSQGEMFIRTLDKLYCVSRK